MLLNSLKNISEELDCAFGVQNIGELDQGDDAIYLNELTNKEKQVYDLLKYRKRKNEWLAGRLAAKSAYKHFCKKFKLSNRSNISVLNDEDRAPYFLESPQLELSITHSNDYAVAAVSYKQIGIDLERIESCQYLLIKYFFSEEESNLINGISAKNSFLKEEVAKYWTRKEALAKCLKLGMKINFRLLDTTNDYFRLVNKSNFLIRLVSHKVDDYYLSIAN